MSGVRRRCSISQALPDRATADDYRRFQLYLAEPGLSIGKRNRIMTGVRVLLRDTLRRHDLAAEIYHLKEPESGRTDSLVASAGRGAPRVLLLAICGVSPGFRSRASKSVSGALGYRQICRAYLRVLMSA